MTENVPRPVPRRASWSREQVDEFSSPIPDDLTELLTEVCSELRSTRDELRGTRLALTSAQDRATYDADHVAQVVSDAQAEIDRQQRGR